MIELVDPQPEIHVQTAEYARLLGFPPGRELDGRSLELANWTRAWYAQNGRPWVYAREAHTLALKDGSVLVDGAPFTSDRLHKTLHAADAHTVILAAVSAGPEIECEAHKAWLDEKPDEYFFLEMFGSAVVEHLTTMTGARLCEWADGEAMAVLPHYSPGYPEWEITDQARLLEVIGRQPLPGRMDVLDSGMLRPKKSLLAVFGVTRHTDRVRKLSELIPCENCSFAGCQFRRAPYARDQGSRANRPSPGSPPPSGRVPSYSVNISALRRWTKERLSLTAAADGTIDALFRYDGTTCSSMGHPLVFHYQVKLGSPQQGYPIREARCVPAPGDVGHTCMCRYLVDAVDLMGAIDREKPLLGRRLEEVLTWSRPTIGPGCYCEPEARQHKWGLVLETIHYALTSREGTDLP
jgi:hypothetical protein